MQGFQRRTGPLGTAAAAVLLAMTLGLAGCGSDGDDGAQGPPGLPGDPGLPGEPGAPADPTQDPLSLAATHAQPVPAVTTASIDNVRVTSTNPTNIEVTFTVDGYTDASANVEVTLAKWVDGTWISMLQRDRQTGDGPTVIRAGNLRYTVDGGRDGEFITFINSDGNRWGASEGDPIDFSVGAVWQQDDQAQAANYADAGTPYFGYVQGILDGIEAAAGTSWDEDAIYRVGVTSRSPEVSRFNAIGYFTGTGLPATNPNPVMTQASCNSCHGETVALGPHGNQRFEPELCTTCHNPFTFDRRESIAEVDGWVNIDSALMMHKIHAGIDGYRVDGSDYSEVRFPDWLFGRIARPDPDVDPTEPKGGQNCTTCHKDDVADVTSLAEAKWNVVSNEACLTCHVGDTLSAAGFNPPHGDFVGEPASACAGCHGDGPDQFAPRADEFHGVTGALAEIEQRKDARVKIVSVTDAVAGRPAQVAWQVVDADGTPYSPVSALNPTVNVGIGWGHGDDWVNDGIDRDNGARGDPWSFSVNDDEVSTVFNGDTATTTLQPLPSEAIAGRNAYAVVYGGGLSINGSDVRPNTAIATLTLGSDATDPVDGLPNERRQIVSSEGCLTCHTTVGRHGTVADDDIMGCVACHNAGSLPRDGSAIQGSVDFMFMVHAIHGIGDGKRERFDRRRDHGYLYVTNPGTVLNCQSCHLPGTYTFPVERNARIGVIADNTKPADTAWDGTGVNSAEASVCFSCHESGVDLDADPVKAHMVTFGATMEGGGSHAGLLGEVSACTGCHTPSK